MLVDWLMVSSNPANEFIEEGLTARAFPALFPTGAADLRSPRIERVSQVQYFQHLTRYKDGRFARDPRFRFHAMNTSMRWQAVYTGKVYVQRNSGFRTATVTEMTAILAQNRSLSEDIMYFGSSLRGTRSYRFK